MTTPETVKQAVRPLEEIVKGMKMHRDDLRHNANYRKVKAYGMSPGPDRWKIEMEAYSLENQASQLEIFIPDLDAVLGEVTRVLDVAQERARG